MKSVSKKTLRKSFLNWFFWNGCSQQAETMLGMAFGQAMAPVIDELYDTKEEKAQALKRHQRRSGSRPSAPYHPVQYGSSSWIYLQRYCHRYGRAVGQR